MAPEGIAWGLFPWRSRLVTMINNSSLPRVNDHDHE